MRGLVRTALLMMTVAVVTACGGGGGGGDSDPPASSRWTMDAYEYVNGGFSERSTSTSADGNQVTTVVVSTATLEGGDTSNGAYSGSSLSFVFKGASVDGVYTLVPSTTDFVNAAASTSPMVIEAQVGIAVTTGSTLYRVSAGRVRVTRDGEGRYHFSTVGSVPAAKALDVLGGVDGAPPVMVLSVFDAY